MEKLLLIPYPKDAKILEGTLDCRKFKLNGEKCFAADDFSAYASNFCELCDDGVEIAYEITGGEKEESYVLEINSDGIKIAAERESGIRYAFCSLRQLFHNYNAVLPLCKITDEPYLKRRGFLLDNGRYFFKTDVVKKFIDLCYLHKLNVFHWHLTEDQGWRIEIDKYPLLTEKGSRRSHTNFGVRAHGGYYTKSEIREIIAYANERGMEVVPEFDVPGHTQAALACYPYLGCFERKLDVATHWGVKHDVMCAGKETTYQFVFDILDEIIDLFGSNTKYIHIGADEVFKGRWKLCKDCQATMEREGLKDEHELQAYFMKRVCLYLKERGFIPIAWNGVKTEMPICDDLVWQDWSAKREADALVLRQAKASGGLINSTSRYTYIDFPHGRISLKDSYNFNPLPENFPEDKLVGAEMTLWTEYIPNFKTGCKYTLPRSCALAESMWLNSEKNDYDGFVKRLKPMLSYLKKEGFIASPNRVVNPNKLRGLLQVIWFEKRQLHWQGLHNLIDDARVKRKYK